MSDASLFAGAGLLWLRIANEEAARQAFDRLDQLTTTRSATRELTMRPGIVNNAEGTPVQ